MECKAVRKRLTAFIDGELDSAVRDVVKTHLNLCSSCSIEYDRMKKTLRAAKAWAPRVLPGGFADAVRERAERGERARPAERRSVIAFPVLDVLPRWSLQAAAACLVLVIGLVLGRAIWPRQVALEAIGGNGGPDTGAQLTADDPVKRKALEMLATLQKLKLIQGMRPGNKETIAEHNVAQFALAKAIDPALAGKVALHQEAEALLAAGQVDEADAILGDLERDEAYPLAVYAGLQRRFGPPVPAGDSVYAELLVPEVLASPERLYRAVRERSASFARTYTEALDAGIKPFEAIRLPESLLPASDDGGAPDGSPQ